MENQQIDLTTLRTPVVLNGCETRLLAREKLMAMANLECQTFQKCSSITLSDLANQPLILSHRYQKYMSSAFEQAGLVCDFYCICEDARTALTMAEKGLGVAILPDSMLQFSDKMKGCSISDADLSTEILLAWKKGRQSDEVREFLKLWDDVTDKQEELKIE